MARMRTTFITRDGVVEPGSFVIEKLPEPLPWRVQEFRLRIVEPASYDPWTRDDVLAQLGPNFDKKNTCWTVTEVDVTP